MIFIQGKNKKMMEGTDNGYPLTETFSRLSSLLASIDRDFLIATDDTQVCILLFIELFIYFILFFKLLSICR